MWTTKIEDKEFTLFFDIDQLKDNKISLLTDDGKIDWLRERINMLLVRPVTLAFTPDQDLSLKERLFISFARLLNIPVRENKNKFRLTEITDEGQGNLVVGMFSILMNGVEALGSFITLPNTGKGDNFKKYMKDYMPMWDIIIAEPTLYLTNNMVDILWKHFRNGIAHGFIIEKGGLEFQADKTSQGYFVTANNYLQIGPRKFIKDFNNSLTRYFDDIKNNADGKRTLFMTRFNAIYPN